MNMHTRTNIHADLSMRARRYRYSPLSNVTPQTVSTQIDAFESGYLREAAMLWETLEHRDDLLRSVVSKRKKSAARHGWVVLPVEGLSQSEERLAKEHAAALDYFYRNVEAEHALDINERGGFKLLARQMMDAVGKRYAVHEIIWNPQREGGATRLSAKFRFVPLPFFENTTGELRFLQNDAALEGTPLAPGAWMTTVGDGLMRASSLAWAVKNVVLNAWAQYCERNGTPALVARSSVARGSAEWTALEECLESIAGGLSAIHGISDEISVLDLSPGSSIPFPLLVERIDRMLAVLWRGADLSTISRDRGYGASLQEKETCALEEDDAGMITETLNRHVDEWVIRYTFGEHVRPLARVQVLVAPRECTTTDLQVDEFLLKHGAPLGVEETMHRYGRKPAARDGAILAAAAKTKSETKTMNH